MAYQMINEINACSAVFCKTLHKPHIACANPGFLLGMSFSGEHYKK
jgi:hypothetical protein